MKKYFSIIFTALIILMAINTKAQVKSYLGLFGGLSFPKGDFAKSVYENNQAGFAKRGATFSLDGAYYIYKKLAIGGTFSFQDQGELNNNDANILATGYTSSFRGDEGTTTATGRFHSFDLLLGPQYSFTYHKFIIDVRVEAGIVKNYTTPEIETTLYNVPDQTATIFQESAKQTVFGYGANLNLRYEFGTNWFFALKGTFINSKALDITTTGRMVDVGRLQTKLPMQQIQGTFGIVHAF